MSTQDYQATLSMHVDDEPAGAEAWGLAVLDALLDLDNVIDADLTATLALGEIIIEFGIRGVNYEDAWIQAATAVRTALHVCGASTAGMEKHIAEVQTSVRELGRVTLDA